MVKRKSTKAQIAFPDPLVTQVGFLFLAKIQLIILKRFARNGYFIVSYIYGFPFDAILL
jgi:hypothetical protein